VFFIHAPQMSNSRIYNDEVQLSAYDQDYLEDVASSIEESRRLQAVVQKLTAKCWKACLSKSPSFPLAQRDRDCLINCTTKYTEMSSYMMKVLTEEAEAELRNQKK
jgi:hypothetical protein